MLFRFFFKYHVLLQQPPHNLLKYFELYIGFRWLQQEESEKQEESCFSSQQY